MKDSQIGFTIKQTKKYEWFVKDVESMKLQEELNAFSKQGWEIFKLDRYDTEMHIYYLIIARRQICKTI